MARARVVRSSSAASLAVGAERVAVCRSAGDRDALGTGNRRGRVSRAGSRESVVTRGSAAEPPMLDTVSLTAEYLHITIDTILTAAAAHQYRTRPDPVADPDWSLVSEASPVSATSSLDLINVPARTGLVLEARIWIDGSYDSGWYDTGIIFDTPGRDGDPIGTVWYRDQ